LSSVLSVWLIAWTVFALNTVNTWDTLTAASWNEIVNKLTSLDTNSTDLVTKSYVDSAISAGSWLQPWTIDRRDCEYKNGATSTNWLQYLHCSSWKTVVWSNCWWQNGLYSCSYKSDGSWLKFNSTAHWYTSFASIRCCKVNQ